MRPSAAALPRFFTLLITVAVLAPAVASASGDGCRTATELGPKAVAGFCHGKIEQRNPPHNPVNQIPDLESDRPESIEFVRAVQPRRAVPIHDALLSERGKLIVDRWLAEQGGAHYERLEPGARLAPA